MSITRTHPPPRCELPLDEMQYHSNVVSCCCIKLPRENSRILHKFSTDTVFLLNISHPMLVESEVVKLMAMDGWWYLFHCLDVIKNEVSMGRNSRCRGSILSLEVLVQEGYQSASV